MSQDSAAPAAGDRPSSPAGRPPFILPSRLTAAQAAPLREALVPLIPAAELTLDGGAVDSVGIAGLQVLVALVKSRAQRPTRWSAVNPTLLGAARLSGLAAALALPTTGSDRAPPTDPSTHHPTDPRATFGTVA